MIDAKAKSTKPRKASPTMTGIVITVDHVYLPLDPEGNVVAGWTASNVFTSKVLRRTHLKAPADCARFLADRDQAEITTPAKASGDLSSEAPKGA
jgi:hypothetical protein